MSSEGNNQYGFIGLGTMGLPLAKTAARGLAGNGSLGVYDLNPAAMADAATLPGVWQAKSPAEIASRCQAVITCLPDDAACEGVYRGSEGLIPALAAGSVTLDLSTVSPPFTAGLVKELKKRKVHHLTGPMLGSKAQAESGQVFFILGGDLDGVRQITPLLAMMGRMHIHVGDAETASKIKLLHNALGAVNYAAVAEALSLCKITGTDMQTFYEVVRNGGGMAFGNYFDRKVPTIIAGDYSPRFKLKLAQKDNRLAKEFVGGLGVPTPILDAAGNMLNEALEDGAGEDDASAVTRIMEKRLGIKLTST